MRSDIAPQLKALVRPEVPLGEALQKLREWEKAGYTREEVYSTLEALRDGDVSEAVEDRILEIMDFVAGYCTPENRVWSE